jgi:membrane protease YdiL (CAAX protease family)
VADPSDPPTPDPDPPGREPPSAPPAAEPWPPPDPGSRQVGEPSAWGSPSDPGAWQGGGRRPDGWPAPGPWQPSAGPRPGATPEPGGPWAPGQPPRGPWPPSGPGTGAPRTGRPARTPLPAPAGPPQVLRLELGLVLLLAFAPGILGLLILALGAGDGTEVDSRLVPAIVGAAFQMFLSWSPVLVIAYLLVRSGEGWSGIGLTRFRGADAGHGVALWVASFVLVLILAQVFRYFGQREVDFLPEALPLWFRVIQAVLIAATAGATEEIVVRGYAQTRLEQLRAPAAVIVLLPTALWGVLHVYQGLGAALTIFCLGVMYAVYFHRTRRLWPLILAHTLFDGTQLVFILTGS